MRKVLLSLTIAGLLMLAFTAEIASAAAGYQLFGDAQLVTPGNGSTSAVEATTTGTNGYGGVDFTVAAGLTLNDVNHLSTDIRATIGTCNTGTPRFSIGVDDGTAVTKYVVTYPTCSPVWSNTGNLVSQTSFVDAAQLGGSTSQQYSTVQAMWGTYPVTDIFLVVDPSNGTQTIQFDNSRVNDVTFTYEPTAVSFSSLSAARSANGVQVHWRTASEISTLGFNVYGQVNGKRAKLNRRLIAAKGGGASYSYLDRSALRSTARRYWIQVVNLDGSRRWYGPVRVAARA